MVLKSKYVFMLFLFLSLTLLFPFVSHAQLFKVSAYYSPDINQMKYVSGSYGGDLAMNGNGTHGADGTPVYVGMISAPSEYAYGTKIFIEGLGVGTVHDRGGAIYTTKGYHKLDIWMGRGDKGRIRAISWGSRMVEGKIVDKNTKEGFTFNSSNTLKTVKEESYFGKNLYPSINDEKEIIKIQKFLGITESGEYDLKTKRAVFLFQKKTGVLNNFEDYGAGVWGPKTRKKANTIYIESEKLSTKTNVKLEKKVTTEIEEKNIIKEESYFGKNLYPGINDEKEIIKIQKFLGITELGEYDLKTKREVFLFQKKTGVLNNFEDYGAGVWGPKTRKKANTIYIESEKLSTKTNVKLEKKVTTEIEEKNIIKNENYFNVSLWYKNKNQKREDVKKIQKFLKDQEIFDGSVSGKYTKKTEYSVLIFQKKNGILEKDEDYGAGVWGPKTRIKANEIYSL
jgi:3D (Asp-Asp-Asp) domain-containing protein/peptidoglycan hydrolase-like protein with peptidoglycan-binding domain